jgi:hypothetical protein
MFFVENERVLNADGVQWTNFLFSQVERNEISVTRTGAAETRPAFRPEAFGSKAATLSTNATSQESRLDAALTIRRDLHPNTIDVK